MLGMSCFVWRSTYHQLTKFDFEILSLNTRGIGGQMNSPKCRKIFNYLKNIALLSLLFFSKKLIVQKGPRMNGQVSGDVAEIVFFLTWYFT